MLRKTLFIVIASALVSTAQAETSKETIRQFYPLDIQGRAAIAIQDEQKLFDAYCVDEVIEKTVTLGDAQWRKYILALGSACMQDGSESNMASQGDGGNAGVFVLENVDDDWQLVASNPLIEVGRAGNAPDGWTFNAYGADSNGEENLHGFNVEDIQYGGGGGVGVHLILLPYDGKIVASAFFHFSDDMSSQTKADVEIVKQADDNGHYPLKLHFSEAPINQETYKVEAFVPTGEEIIYMNKDGRYLTEKAPLGNNDYYF